MKELFKVLTTVALVAALSVSMISCGNGEKKEDDKAADVKVEEKAKDEKEPAAAEKEKEPGESEVVVDKKEEVETKVDEEPEEEPKKAPVASKPGEITVDKTVIFDEGDIKVTITGYEIDEFWGDTVTYTVENNSDTSVTVSANYTYINGFAVTDGIFETVAAGKKANGEFSIDTDGFMGDAGIIEMYLNIYNSDTYEDIFESEYTYFETSAADEVEADYDIDGDVIYDDNGVTILYCGMEYEEYWGYTAKLYIENNRNAELLYEGTDASVNDMMVEEWLYNYLPVGGKCFEEIWITDTDLEDNNIDEIEKIEMSFDLNDGETYEEIDSFTAVVFEK